MVHVSHPRYFGLFNPTPTFPAQCADRLTAAFNPQLASSITSPLPVALEAHVIRAVADRAGLPAETGGHFTSGGSEANLTAALCALARGCTDFVKHGIRANQAQPTIYASNASHLVWLKIAQMTGIGRSAVRLVRTDGSGRMDTHDLRRMIEQDVRSGHQPILVVSTAGTTAAGMIDPIRDCAAIAASVKAWHHVDAAWGGAVIASDKLRPLLDGIELADSVTIDAHKWLATTMSCGMFLTRRTETLSAVFNVRMSCMPSADDCWDPYLNSVQWSRRFVGLRLFTSLAAAGWIGYASYLERSVTISESIAASLVALGWTHVNHSNLAVLCLRPPVGARSATDIASSVVKSGEAWISAVDHENETLVRICITSGETTLQDISRLIEAIGEATYS